MMIKCIGCLEVKDEAEFHRNPKKLNGRVGRCKVCVAAYGKEYRAIPEVKEAKAAYGKEHRTIPEVKEAKAANNKEYQQTDAGKASHKKAHDKILATPEGRQKHRARHAVSHAMEAGRMIKPERCQWAGPVGLDLHICEETKIEAHHHQGYEPDSWLDVQWLCREHHMTADKLKEAWNAWKIGLSRELTLIAQSS